MKSLPAIFLGLISAALLAITGIYGILGFSITIQDQIAIYGTCIVGILLAILLEVGSKD